jgi:hypothetical protein
VRPPLPPVYCDGQARQLVPAHVPLVPCAITNRTSCPALAPTTHRLGTYSPDAVPERSCFSGNRKVPFRRWSCYLSGFARRFDGTDLEPNLTATSQLGMNTDCAVSPVLLRLADERKDMTEGGPHKQ